MRVHEEFVDLTFRAKLLHALKHESKLFNVTGLGDTCPRGDELSSALGDLGYPRVPP